MDPNKAALLIASFEYEDPYFRQLKAPAQDVKSLSRVLSEPALGGFCEVKTLINESKESLVFAVEEFFDNRNRDDLLLLYFSCHGIKDEDGRLYYATRNTRHTRLVSTAVPAYQVNDLIAKCLSRRKVLILDCCYSGAFSKGFLAKGDSAVGVMEEFKQGRGLVTLASSDAFQYSFEEEEAGPGGETTSVFTRALVEGIETGKADEDGDQLISLDELYHFAFERVQRERPQQHPRRAGEVEGDLIIACNPRPPQAAEVPLWLQKEIESDFPPSRLAAVFELDRLLQGRNKGLARSAYAALVKLKEDDSRKIATAAEACLKAADERNAEVKRAQAAAEAERAVEAEEAARQRAEEEEQERARREVAAKAEAAAKAEVDRTAHEQPKPELTLTTPITDGKPIAEAKPTKETKPITAMNSVQRRARNPKVWITALGCVALVAAGTFTYLRLSKTTQPPGIVVQPIDKASAKVPEMTQPVSVDQPTANNTASTEAPVPKEPEKQPSPSGVKEDRGSGRKAAPAESTKGGVRPAPKTITKVPDKAQPTQDPTKDRVAPRNEPALVPPASTTIPQGSPTTSAPNRITVGKNTQESKLISQIKPVYPALAIQSGVSGTVRFEAIVGKDGTIQKLQIISGNPLLVKAAADAVRQWRYEPTVVNGQRVEVVTEINVTFSLTP